MVRVLEQWMNRHTPNNEDVFSLSIGIMIEEYFYRVLGENGSIVNLVKRDRKALGHAWIFQKSCFNGTSRIYFSMKTTKCTSVLKCCILRVLFPCSLDPFGGMYKMNKHTESIAETTQVPHQPP